MIPLKMFHKGNFPDDNKKTEVWEITKGIVNWKILKAIYLCSLPYNNFRTLKRLVRFPRAKVNSNKIFKLSGWIDPSYLKRNSDAQIWLPKTLPEKKIGPVQNNGYPAQQRHKILLTVCVCITILEIIS